MQLAGIFGDHMVLQRGIPLPVWGWGEPGEAVIVLLAGHVESAIVGVSGAWRMTLPALEAGGPFELVVSATREIRVRDIMVGEVWICSGQSNMEMGVRDAADGVNEVTAADQPGIRLFTVPKQAKIAPTSDVTAAWSVCGPDTVGSFSATAYYFGRELQRALGVPIGLINSSWGGTRIEAWTSRDALLGIEECREELLTYERIQTDPVALAEEHAQRLLERKDWEEANLPKDTGNSGYTLGWAAPEWDQTGWGKMNLPGYWQPAGHPISGVFWFRREVVVTEADAGRDLLLSLGPIDKTDVTYFNGEEIGRIGKDTPSFWSVARQYRVPGRLVQVGRNVIAVRVMSDCYAGGFGGRAEALRLTTLDETRTIARLVGPWRYRIEQDFGEILRPREPFAPFGDGNPNSPTILYQGMISPVAPFGLRGAIWYQGESNSEAPGRYRQQLPALIRDWRAMWNQASFAFLFVQLPNYGFRDEQGRSSWAEIREAQSMALALPETGMAVTIDIGDESNIHPQNKQDVGRRLALSALGGVYQRRDIVACGPLFKSCSFRGNEAHIVFTHTGSGLVAKEGGLHGFTMAGEDRRFIPANAVIGLDGVAVSSTAVPHPVAVRYAWANNPAATLFNQAGLPASPFRTDDWMP
ncbi:MAG: sialate O-acetylesterase [bacterium]